MRVQHRWVEADRLVHDCVQQRQVHLQVIEVRLGDTREELGAQSTLDGRVMREFVQGPLDITMRQQPNAAATPEC